MSLSIRYRLVLTRVPLHVTLIFGACCHAKVILLICRNSFHVPPHTDGHLFPMTRSQLLGNGALFTMSNAQVLWALVVLSSKSRLIYISRIILRCVQIGRVLSFMTFSNWNNVFIYTYYPPSSSTAHRPMNVQIWFTRFHLLVIISVLRSAILFHVCSFTQVCVCGQAWYL